MWPTAVLGLLLEYTRPSWDDVREKLVLWCTGLQEDEVKCRETTTDEQGKMVGLL